MPGPPVPGPPTPGPGQQPYPQQPGPYPVYPSGAYPPPYGTPGYYPAPPRNGLGIAALTIGLVAIVAAPTVVVGIVCGLVALALGIVAYRRTRRGEATNPGVSIGGIVAGAVGVLGSLVMAALIIVIATHSTSSELRSCLDSAQGDPSAIVQCHLDYGSGGPAGDGRSV